MGVVGGTDSGLDTSYIPLLVGMKVIPTFGPHLPLQKGHEKEAVAAVE